MDIEQKFSKEGDPLCTHCGEVVSRLKFRVKGEERVGMNSNLELSKLPFQGRFCSLECSQRYFYLCYIIFDNYSLYSYLQMTVDTYKLYSVKATYIIPIDYF